MCMDKMCLRLRSQVNEIFVLLQFTNLGNVTNLCRKENQMGETIQNDIEIIECTTHTHTHTRALWSE